jgi:hypothetical protein
MKAEDAIQPVAKRFAELNDVEVELVKRGGERKSKHSENWAARAFDEWRLCKGLSIDKSIGIFLRRRIFILLWRCSSNSFFKFKRWTGVCILL